MSQLAVATALMDALKTLGPGTGNSDDFKLVDWFAGQISQSGIDQETIGSAHALLLGWEGDEIVQSLTVQTLCGDSVRTCRGTWTVFLVVQDLRGESEAMAGTAGVIVLKEKVFAVLDTLTSDAIVGDGRVRYVGSRVAHVLRGVAYVYALRFTTDYEHDPVTDTTPIAQLARVDFQQNLDGLGDENPINEGRATELNDDFSEADPNPPADFP